MTKKEVFMHHAFSRGGAAVWLSLLLVLPVLTLSAASLAPLGTLRCDGVVYLRGETARLGSVVYSGDQLRTAEGRATISLPGGDLMVLDRQSSAALRRSPEGLFVGLEKGRVVWALAAQAPLRVQTDGLTISPRAAFPSLAEVAMRGDGSLVVAVHRGKISIADLRAEPVAVSAGQLITISPRLSQAGQTLPVGTAAHGKMTLGEKLRTFRFGSLSHQASVAVATGVLGGAAATSIVVPLTVGEEENISPSTP
jgi:hypothetical protein